MWVDAWAGSWRTVVALDLMAPGGVHRVPHHSRHSRTRGQTSLCWVWRNMHRNAISDDIRLKETQYEYLLSLPFTSFPATNSRVHFLFHLPKKVIIQATSYHKTNQLLSVITRAYSFHFFNSWKTTGKTFLDSWVAAAFTHWHTVICGVHNCWTDNIFKLLTFSPLLLSNSPPSRLTTHSCTAHSAHTHGCLLHEGNKLYWRKGLKEVTENTTEINSSLINSTSEHRDDNGDSVDQICRMFYFSSVSSCFILWVHPSCVIFSITLPALDLFPALFLLTLALC